MGQLATRRDLADSLIVPRGASSLVDVALPAIKHEPAALVYRLPDFISDPERQLRLIELHDGRRSNRISWLNRFITCSQKFTYRRDSLRFLSQVDAGFSILFLSSDDLNRLNTIIRELRVMLPSKGIVPVISRKSGNTLVELLQSGADDVLDCEMDIEEAIGRVHALQRRLRWREEKCKSEMDKDVRFEIELRSLTRSKLTPTEKKILVCLVLRRDRALPYQALMDYGNCVSLKSLMVKIWSLRNKLLPGVLIRNEPGFGYSIAIQRYDGQPVQVSIEPKFSSATEIL